MIMNFLKEKEFWIDNIYDFIAVLYLQNMIL